MLRLRMAAAAVGVAAGLLGVASAIPASAAPAAARDGVCDPGEFCLYWGPGYTGSVSDFTTSVSNYGTTEPSCYDYKGPGYGQGECVKNNAMSAWNRTGSTVTVFFNSGFGGHGQPFGPGQAGDLDSTLSNNNASHRIG